MTSYLKLLENFVRFPPVFTKVFNLFAFGAASIVLHFCALWVYFRTLRLVTYRPVLCANARTVRVSWEEAFPKFVHEATVVHTTFPPIVVENYVVVDSPFGLVRRIILGTDEGW